MQHINRDCFVVMARHTFVEWLRSVPELEMPNVTLDEVNSEALVLLVPHIQSEQAARKYIEPFKADFVRYLFREWSVDESAWPDLEQAPFDHWFTLQYHSMVYDMTWNKVLERDGPEELFHRGGAETDIASYKALIAAEFERTGDWGTPEEPDMIAAYRAIDRYRRTAGDIAGVLELQLTMVESGTAYWLRYGDQTASFHEAMTMVMDDFVVLAHEYPAELIRADLGQRLYKLAQEAGPLGWGYGEAIDGSVHEVARLLNSYRKVV